MSCTTRSAILRARKNSESERETRNSRKRKKLNSSWCDAGQKDKNNASEGSGNTERIQKENDQSLDVSQVPSMPVDCPQLSCMTFSFPRHCDDSRTPLPILNWADSEDFWTFLKDKDREYPKFGQYMGHHPSLQPKMRTILLDWLIEVCEVYRLHRETFHLAASYVDRYLKVKGDIQKSRLQLVGVTALFIASKLEEIYPPKLSEFSYVTDGACTDDEILMQELVMLKALDWKLTPLTINTWLRIYLQLRSYKQDEKAALFLTPVFSGKDLVQAAKLLDLCVLDLESLDFPNRILAAAALHHTVSTDITKVTDIAWPDLFPCIQWMKPFAAAVQEQGTVNIRLFEKVPPEDCPNVQTHTNSLNLLAEAVAHKNEYVPAPLSRRSPPSPAFGVLTPPSSTKKGKTSR
ncbi:G1 S-specific cyclin-E1 isoform X1 [Paramuricea clavata]|uniref:G1 S-specific cyclin-E1 isoform X1 n=1 Tax=Paramuricea clavata TaxID=317549 RepID=A0A7D9DBL0_PARCT|nr:G1 S-specific cyclin-E1 isoform X1 [Paramuricea clavata]